MKVLFGGTSGINMSRVLEKLGSEVNHKNPIKHFKLEDYFADSHIESLREFGFENTFIDEESRGVKSRGGIQILLRRPKNYLRTLWKKSFRKMQSEASSEEDVFYAMHAIYYQTQYREFFVAYDDRLIGELGLDCIVTLIDDIYDIHARLRKRNQVYSNFTLELQFKEAPHRRAFTRIFHLMCILEWRSKEILAAEQLAHRLGIPHIVLALKHPLQIAKSLLLNYAPMIYVSHPITSVRELFTQGKTEDAQSIEHEINSLSMELRSNNSIAPIFPTTIDELIIAENADPDNPQFLPLLNRRWEPLEQPDDLLYCTPDNHAENPLDVENLFIDEKGRIRSNIEESHFESIKCLIGDILVPAIIKQISSRDRTLVDQCSAICVYRPYFNGHYSTGVGEEISHRKERYDFKIDARVKPCIIYCPPEDLALVRLGLILYRIGVIIKIKYSQEQKEELIGFLRSQPESWERLHQLLPDPPWTGEEIRLLIEKSGLKVANPIQLEKGAVSKENSTNVLVEDLRFWNNLIDEFNSHPLATYLFLDDTDIWIEKNLTPRSFAEIFIEEIKKRSL